METKKNVKANLEKARSSFLLIGIILATTLLIFAFNWKSLENISGNWGNEEKMQEDMNTVITKPEPIPADENKQETVKKAVVEIIELVENTSEIKEVIEIWNEGDPVIEVPVVIEEPKKIWETTEVKPRFPGGERALRLFIAKNLVYPSAARENGIEGTVSLRFEVTKTGDIGKIEIYNSNQDELLINAAKKVIRKLPKFKPGMQNGQKVNVWFSIPITFKLN